MYDIYNIIDYSSYNHIKKSKEEMTQLKNELLNNGKFALYRGRAYANYSKYIAEKYGTEVNHLYDKFLSLDLQLTNDELKACRQIFDSHRQKLKRLRSKLKYRLENFNCLWLTLTFRDEVLQNTNEDTRRVYIRRYLKSLKVLFYVANIDYGDKEKNKDSNEREHYHAIIQADRIELNSYDYGFIYVEKIINTEKSFKKISQYITKLTNHAYKDSTKGRARLIYSRG